MYRLALDLGTNSIGWCLFILEEQKLPPWKTHYGKTTALQPVALERMGVRIFSDGREPKTGASLAVKRRETRSARRRRDRYLGRRNALMSLLVAYALMPQKIEERKALELLDPYPLRAKGLDTRIALHAFGRVLFHINQRRGFKSNRKTDKGDESGKIASGITRLKDHMQTCNARTVGEFLYTCKQRNQPTRVRAQGSGATLTYPFYSDRSLLEEEFDALWRTQKQWHPQLTDELYTMVKECIFHQRPLMKRPELIGRCSLNPSATRAPLAHPLNDTFRILQELNHMRIVSASLEERLLTLDERNALFTLLMGGKDLSLDAIRKKLGLDASVSMNLENGMDKKIAGSKLGKVLGAEKCFGSAWNTFSDEMKAAVVEHLLDDEDTDVLTAFLTTTYGVARNQAEEISKAKLPDGYGRHCVEVLKDLCRVMQEQVLSYAEARVVIGFPYKEETGEIQERLPYYGQILKRYVGHASEASGDPAAEKYGRIANPTVHIALNQLRLVVNEIIKEYGLPAQIVLEVARDLKNGTLVKEMIIKEQLKHKKANDARRRILEENNIKVTADSLLRMRLWEELDPADVLNRACVYTGERISFTRLFSDDIEVEHILPFSRTLDNSALNKTLSVRTANRDKGNKSPYEAFGKRPGYDWDAIVNRAHGLPERKKKRFAADAMALLEEEDAFLQRQLTDTQYIASVAREYLCAVCPSSQVWGTPGRLTANLAYAWEFGKKNRNTHRHHAIDAALIGVTDRPLLQRVATYHAAAVDTASQKDKLRRLLKGLEQPWVGFTAHVLVAAAKMLVSHRPDHNIHGALHNETAYGFVPPDEYGKNAQHRVDITTFSLKNFMNIKEAKLKVELLRDVTGKAHTDCLAFVKALSSGDLADKNLRGADAKEGTKKVSLEQRIKDFTQMDEATCTAALRDAATRKGIRRIRIVEKITLIPVRNKKNEVYKGFKGGGNAWVDVYEDANGKWIEEVVSTFQANSKDCVSSYAGQGLKHILRLFKGDMVVLEEDGAERICYVQKFTKGVITLAEHFEANADARASASRKNSAPGEEDLFRFIYKSVSSLQKSKTRAIHVTPAGKIIYKERPCRVAKRCRSARE